MIHYLQCAQYACVGGLALLSALVFTGGVVFAGWMGDWALMELQSQPDGY